MRTGRALSSSRHLACDAATRCTVVNAFGSTCAGIVVTDWNLKILLANDAFLAMTGYPLEEAVGQRPCFLGSGGHDRALFRLILRSVTRSGQWSGQVRIQARDGSRRTVWLQVDAIGSEPGNPGHVLVLSDLARFGQRHEELFHLAYHDPLTGLPNRQLLLDRIGQTLLLARRSGTRFALLFIDLDGFKEVNDRLGHLAGDRLLVEIADRLRTTVRMSDTVARLSGDEFVVILGDAQRDADAVAVASKILTALAQPVHAASGTLYISASVGIAYSPDSGTAADELLTNADMAMYRAKRKGGACYCVHATDHDPQAVPVDC